MSKLVYSLVLRKLLFKKNLFLCLGAILLLYLYLRIFHCQTHFPNFRSASNQNNFKVLFPLCFSQDLQYQNRLQSSLQNFNLQILQLEKLENKYTIGFDLKISPFEMFLLLILIKMTLKSHLRGKAPSTFVTT